MFLWFRHYRKGLWKFTVKFMTRYVNRHFQTILGWHHIMWFIFLCLIKSISHHVLLQFHQKIILMDFFKEYELFWWLATLWVSGLTGMQASGCTPMEGYTTSANELNLKTCGVAVSFICWSLLAFGVLALTQDEGHLQLSNLSNMFFCGFPRLREMVEQQR